MAGSACSMEGPLRWRLGAGSGVVVSRPLAAAPRGSWRVTRARPKARDQVLKGSCQGNPDGRPARFAKLTILALVPAAARAAHPQHPLRSAPPAGTVPPCRLVTGPSVSEQLNPRGSQARGAAAATTQHRPSTRPCSQIPAWRSAPAAHPTSGIPAHHRRGGGLGCRDTKESGQQREVSSGRGRGGTSVPRQVKTPADFPLLSAYHRR